MALDDIVNAQVTRLKAERVMIISDIHAPFHDKKAVSIAKKYIQDYKPNHLIINGDVVDFYSISRWDKSPSRKLNVSSEIESANYVLDYIFDATKKSTNKYFNLGNHDIRMRKFVWRNPELDGLEELDISNLLKMKDRNVEVSVPSTDYWRTDTGHLKIGDTLITHGDNTLNGCKGGMNAGYNTMKSFGMSTIIGHTHRLNKKSHTSPYHNWVGIEGGHLAKQTGTADWQQGFVTYEMINGKGMNYRLHPIQNGQLIADNKIYKGTNKW